MKTLLVLAMFLMLAACGKEGAVKSGYNWGPVCSAQVASGTLAKGGNGDCCSETGYDEVCYYNGNYGPLDPTFKGNDQ